MIIRLARASDAPEFLALERSTFPTYASSSAGARADALQFAHQLKAAPEENRLFYVATDDAGKLLGTATAKPFETTKYGRSITHHTGPVAVLSQVAVHEGVRRRGVGSALVRAVLEGLTTKGFAVALAHVPDELTPWYERGGWGAVPTGHGFAWAEFAGPGSERFTPPEWPAEQRRIDTPRFSVVPDGDGYDRLVFAELAIDGSRLMFSTPFPLGETTEESAFNANRAMLSLTFRVPRAAQLLSESARFGLRVGGLTPAENKRWPTGWESVRDAPFD